MVGKVSSVPVVFVGRAVATDISLVKEGFTSAVGEKGVKPAPSDWSRQTLRSA
jgi:hypothetical protein